MQLLYASHVCRVMSMVSCTVRPEPMFSPKVRLRESGDWHVATRSPTPAKPWNVSGSAPKATPSRAISAKPRVISDAWEFSPRPIPTAMPLATAITFLTDPPISVPTTSVVQYGRK